MKRLFKFRYPKLMVFVLMIILAYYLFSNESVQRFVKELGVLSYFGSFIGGILFSFGFSAPFAAGFFVTLEPTSFFHVIINAIIAGFGSMISDLTIFKIIRFSFMNEFKRLEKTKVFLEIDKLFSEKHLHKIGIYLLYVFAGIVIASPLPDEVGVTMLAGLTKIKTYILAIISFILNSLGIMILILL